MLLYDRITDLRFQYDLEVIHSELNDSDFVRFWEEGQSLTVDEAAATALEE